MSHLVSYMKMVQAFCEECPEIDETLRKIEMLQKENEQLEKDVEDEENEGVRLQIELSNLELISPPDENPNETADEETNMQLLNTCLNMRSALSEIEFDKIVQYNQIVMQEKHRKECQIIEDNIARLLKGHQEMEQRDVVQRYRKAELEHKETINQLERVKKSGETILEENLTRLDRIVKKRNDLIVYLAAGSKEMQKLKDQYQHLREYSEKIASLNKRKAELMEQIEIAESKNIFTLKPYNNDICSGQQSSPKILQTIDKDMRKFPSFNEILKSVKQDLAPIDFRPDVTVIENTTNITVKSTLRKNHDNSMEFNHSITTQHTKQVCFKMPSDETSSDSPETEDISELNKNMSIKELLMPTEDDEFETANDNMSPQIDENEISTEDKNTPKVTILQNVLIKPASNDSLQNKENIPPLTMDKEQQSENIQKTDEQLMPPPPSFPKKVTEVSSPEFGSGSESETDLKYENVLKEFNNYHSTVTENSELTFPSQDLEMNSGSETKQSHDNDMDYLSFGDYTFDFNENNDDNESEFPSVGIVDFVL